MNRVDLVFESYDLDVIVPSGSPLLGFVPNENGRTTAVVVPRFWFEKGNMKPGMELPGGLIVLPDKGERTVFCQQELKGFQRKQQNGQNHPEIVQSRRSFGAQTFTKEEINTMEMDDSERVIALILLLWRYEHNSAKRAQLIRLISGFSHLNLVLARSLVSHIRERMRELRRIYKQTVIESSTVKGRVLLPQSIPLLMNGIPRVFCEVDEFTLTSKHYSALMTALDFIHASTLSGASEKMEKLFFELSIECRKLRVLFKEIPSLSKREAIFTLSRMPLPPQLNPWRDIFRYSLHILQGSGEGPSKINIGVFLPLGERSSDLWENVLMEIAERVFTDVTHEGHDANKLEAPWRKISSTRKPSSPKKPDLRFVSNNNEVILDAKYYGDVSKVLQSSGYQFLGYALLPRLHGESNQLNRKLSFAVPEYSSEIEKGKCLVRSEMRYSLNNSIAQLSQTEDWIATGLTGFSVCFPPVEAIIDAKNSWWDEVSEHLKVEVEGL